MKRVTPELDWELPVFLEDLHEYLQWTTEGWYAQERHYQVKGPAGVFVDSMQRFDLE